MKKQKFIAISTAVLSIGLSVAFIIFKDLLKDASALGLFGIFLINAIASATLFVASPAFLTVFTGGSIYPPVLVALAGSLGSASGDILGFVLGSSGRKVLDHKLQKHFWLRVLESVFRKHANWILFLFAFIPNPIFDSIGILAGIFAVPLPRFFAIVFVGRFIRFLAFAYLGSKIE